MASAISVRYGCVIDIDGPHLIAKRVDAGDL
jgi:hypothetical protein